MRQVLRHPLTPLCVFTLEATVWFTAAMIAGRSVAPLMQLCIACITVLLLLMWIESDARHRGQIPCYDFGFLCMLFLPLSVPWYCLWSRGWKGLGILALLGCLWVLPYLAADITWQLLYGAS